ncbi:MAG: hypothetical protein Q9215_000346 [Flavoplaca cf. flavocitrina]
MSHISTSADAVLDMQLSIRAVPKKPGRLDSLPQEIYDQIFEHASSPRTRLKRRLWPLLFVSKRMYLAVLPTIYRRISFEIDSSVGSYKANYKLLQLADKENQGLLHIEEVQLHPRDELERNPSTSADYPDAFQLLAVIPKDQLRRFNWNSCHELPQEILRLLWKRQRKLSNIELVQCNKPLDDIIDELELDDSYFYQHATELRIADVVQGILPTAAPRILRERPQISTLTLDFGSLNRRLQKMLQTFDDDGTRLNQLGKAYHDTLLKELFRSPKQVRLAAPLAITTLHLHCLDLWHSPCMLSSLKWQVLENLHVISCERSDILLMRLSQLAAEERLRLRTFRIYHEQKLGVDSQVSDDIQTDLTIYSVDKLLLSMKDTLSELWIVMRGLYHFDRLLGPMAAGITNHGKSLLQLTADVRGYRPADSKDSGEQHVGWFEPEIWEEVCASMGRLEQVYVPFPPVVADENLTARDEYYSYLDTALQIPTLKTLNATTWPYPLHTKLYHPNDTDSIARIPYIIGPWKAAQPYKGSYLPVDFYHHCLGYLVEYIIRRRSELIFNPFKPLDIVGFGLVEREHYMSNLEDQLSAIYFFNIWRKDYFKGSPHTEQWTYQQLQRTSRGCELLSGVVDIDWMVKNIREKKLIRGDWRRLRP